MLVNTTFKKAGEVKTVLISFADKLMPPPQISSNPQSAAALASVAEQLAGTPTVEEIGSSDLSFTGIGLNPQDLSIKGIRVPANQGVLFDVAQGMARQDYTIRITASSSASPAQILVEDLRFSIL